MPNVDSADEPARLRSRLAAQRSREGSDGIEVPMTLYVRPSSLVLFGLHSIGCASDDEAIHGTPDAGEAASDAAGASSTGGRTGTGGRGNGGANGTSWAFAGVVLTPNTSVELTSSGARCRASSRAR